METNLSGATSAQTKKGVVSAQTVLIIAALVAIVGFLIANQPSAERNGGSAARSQGTSVTVSAETAVTMPAEEYQPELLYQTATNGNYETAIEVQKILRAKEQLQLEEQMRMAEAARAAGYMTAEMEAY